MYRKDKKEEYYTLKARKEGYPARSVYKLEEIDKKYHLIKKGDSVLDLGCAPGSWLLYLSNKVGDTGKVIGVDISDITIPPRANIIFIKKSVMDLNTDELKTLSKEYQAVVSDLAPSTSGIEIIDVGKSFSLANRALELAEAVLIPAGNFLCKIFEGESTNEFIKEVSKSFKTVKRFRPKAVIRGSKEFYIIGMGLIRAPK